MAHGSDVRIRNVTLYYLPIKTRLPLKFGPETTTHTTCARALVRVEGRNGVVAEGWGETPLSVAWVWPSTLGYETRLAAMQAFTAIVGTAWAEAPEWGHPLETGHRFVQERLPSLHRDFNAARLAAGDPPMPWLAALVCSSPFDLATHDAYGILHRRPSFATYNGDHMNHDLAWFYSPEYAARFAGRYPQDFLARPVPQSLPAWHLVGGKDLLLPAEATGAEPDDGYPVLLPDWIERDGLQCLKVKLAGTDAAWDYERLRDVGRIAVDRGVLWLTADFNCTVTDPAYVNEILDRLLVEQPRIYGMILYVEQPFPYDLEANRIDVHSVSRAQAAVHGRERARLEARRAGPDAGLDRRRAQDLQDPDRRAAQPVLGKDARHDADGPGPDQPDARADLRTCSWPPTRARSWASRPTRCSSIPTPRRRRRPCTRACSAAGAAGSRSSPWAARASATGSARSPVPCPTRR